MERKTTKFKYLLLIPALFLGLSVIAQKAEPVKQASGKSTVEQAVSNQRPANWQLEQELQGVLDGKGGEAVSAKPKPQNRADNLKVFQDYEAKKALHALDFNGDLSPDQKAAIQAKMSTLGATKIPSTGLAPKGQPSVSIAEPTPNVKFPGDMAYAYNAYDPTAGTPTGPMHFVLNTPGSVTSIATYTGTDFLAGASWALGEWYAGTYSAAGNSEFVKVNTSTGARTVINSSTGISITGLAFDWTTNTMYAIAYTSTTALYTIDLITGNATLVGDCGAYLGIGLGCNQEGQLYMVDIIADVLVAINKSTGAATNIGSIGISANYAQDVEFDNSDNTMYYASFNAGTFAGELRTLNLTTGASTLVGTFAGGMEVTGFAIQNLPFITYPDDVGVAAVTGPVSSTSLGASEIITCNIRNYGSAAQQNIPVQYTINGGAPVINTFAGPIAPGATMPFSFTTTADMSTYGNYNIVVCTALPGDQNTNNDCKPISIQKIMPTWTDTIYPQNAAYWTGSTNGTTFTQSSLIQLSAGNVEGGWAKFDISNIPGNTQIPSLKLGHYISYQSGAPYYHIRKLANDPMTGTPSGVFTQIQTGTQYVNTSSGYAVGWHVWDLPAQARTDLSAAAAIQDWFAVGFYEFEACTACYLATMDGWQESHRPYMVVTYGYIPGPIDLGISAVDAPITGGGLSATENVKVWVKNYGSTVQSNIPVEVTVTGPTGSVTLNGVYPGPLAPGATSATSFTVGQADFHIFGNYTIHACTNIAGDAFVNNNCKTRNVINHSPLSILGASSPVSGAGLTATEPLIVNMMNIGTSILPAGTVVNYSVTGNSVVTGSWTLVNPLGIGGLLSNQNIGTLDLHLYGTYTITICPFFAGNTYPNDGCYTYTVVNSVPTVTDTFYPLDLAYWTGSTNGSTFTQNSLIKVNSGNLENGWAKFNINDMPSGVQVNSINEYFYTYSQSGAPFFYLRRLMIDPMANTPSVVMSAITSGANYVYASGGYGLGWHNFELGAAANADLSLQSAVIAAQKWFATSYYEYETCVGCYYGTIQGWQEVETPYLIVNYTPPIAHDVAVMSIDVEPFMAVGLTTPKATVKNFGIGAETFTVTMTGPGGYSNTQTVTALPAGQSIQVTFAQWNAPLGPATLHACVDMASDMNFGNNCKDKSFVVEAKLTLAYAYNAYDPSAVLPEGPIKFFLQHPGTITSLAPTVSGEFISAGCWANGVWYTAEYSYSNNSNLWTINPNTGAMTLIGPMGFNVSGMSFDHTTGIMWAVAAYTDDLGAWRTNIYTVNMTTGAMDLVRECGPIGLAINLACSQQGMLLFAELTNDRLWAYDPLIDELELMGPLGMNLNYAQDAEFDKSDNVLYFAGYGSTGTLFTVNLATGQLTTIGNFQGGAEITGFAIPYTWTPIQVDMGAMWITHPTIGNLTDGEPVVVRVRNYGLTTVTDMNLTAQYLTTTFTDNWAVWGYPQIDPGMYFDYAFIPVLDLSAAGSHCIKAWISDIIPVGDVNKVNDTVAKCVNNVSCGLITCFPNSIDEPEPCTNNENGGCYSDPNAFVDLANGDVYCGTLWKVDTLRDTDWYRFTLGTPKGIAIKAKAEFNVDIILIKLPCTATEVIQTKSINKCTTDSLVFSALGAGQYAIVFAHSWIDFNTACNNNTKYTFSFAIRPAKYCPAGSSVCDEFISNVQVSTTPAFSNPSNCSPGGYKDYTNLTINVDQDATTTYNMTISNGYPYTADQCAVWVDWNVDYDFFDTGEKIVCTNSPGNGPYLTSFMVPAFAVPGPTRLRTRITYTGALEPCGITTYGEVEDYTLYVHAQIPAIVTTIGSLNDACPGNKVVPVTVEEFNGVFGFNIVLGLDAGVTYLGYQNINPELGTGTVTVSPVGNTVQMNWFSIIPANIGSGKLMDLVLQTTSGTHNLIWDESVSQYSSLITGVFDDTYNNGTLTFGNCSDLSGMVKYKNNINSVLRDSVWVKLYTPGNVFYAQQYIDNTGHYSFPSLPNNTYTIRTVSAAPGLNPVPPTKLWVGGNATDALIILRHFVGMLPQLTGLNKDVADVNQSGGTPNAVDALAVSRRFVQAIQNFAPAPDWYFQVFTVTIDGTANQVQEIRGLCAGDVNGSGIPLNSIPSKVSPSIFLNTEGTMYIDNAIVDVPVMVQNSMSIGAVSLVLNYPNNLDIVGVKVANSPENMTYTAKNGQIRIAWFTMNPIDLKAGEVLVTLQVKANSISNKDMNFFSTEESVLANDVAQNYESASLMMPKLVSLSNTDNYSLSNFPNPFSASTEITYSIAKGGTVSLKVYNVLGEEVATVVNADQTAGTYTVTFDGSTLPKGVYVYKLQVNDVTKANSMVITQ